MKTDIRQTMLLVAALLVAVSVFSLTLSGVAFA